MLIVRTPGVFWDVVDGQTVVCHPVTGELHELNSTAALVWDACDHTRIELLTDRIAAAYPDHDVEAISADIQLFINFMRDKGVLRVED